MTEKWGQIQRKWHLVQVCKACCYYDNMTSLLYINWKPKRSHVHCMWLKPSQSQPMLAAEQGFQNQEVCLQVLSSLLSPSCIFCSRPSFPMAKTSKPSFFDFSSLQNTKETLAICWLVVFRLFQTLISTSSILLSVVRRCKQNWCNTLLLIVTYCNMHTADYVVW